MLKTLTNEYLKNIADTGVIIGRNLTLARPDLDDDEFYAELKKIMLAFSVNEYFDAADAFTDNAYTGRFSVK